MGALCGGGKNKKPDPSPTQERENGLKKYMEPKDMAAANENYTPINKTELGVDDFRNNAFGNHAKRYKVDAHQVTTKDGHILKFFRVNLTHDEKENCYGNQHRINHTVVLLSPPTLAADFCFQGHHSNSPGGYFVNRGYDVWALNPRGSKYSHSHSDPNISPQKYFDYSFDDMVEFDYPALYNYIVNFKNLRTLDENNKITSLGFFGSDVFLGMLANLCVEQPERYSFPFDCVEKTIGFLNIHFRSMMQDKFLKSHMMDQEMTKAFHKESEEMNIWNWNCGWPGADQRWRKLMDHMVGEKGYHN